MPSTRNNWRLRNLEKELQKADRRHIQEEEKKMEKSIDLGKLQSDVLKAEALVKSNFQSFYAADRKYMSAVDARDQAKKRLEKSRDALDTARRAMVEAARTIASS